MNKIMNKITRKQKIIAVIIFLVLVLTLSIIFIIKKTNEPKSPISQYCFAYSGTENDIKIEEHISIFVNKKTQRVNGTKNLEKKDGDNSQEYKGILAGLISENDITTQYEYTENQNRIREKEFYTLGFGVLVKKIWPTTMIGGIATPDTTKSYKKRIYTKENCLGLGRNQPFSLFTDKEKQVSFSYPKTFSVKNGNNEITKDWSFGSKYDGKILATMSIPKTFQPNTNFSEAKFTIGISSDNGAFESCLSKEDEGQLGSIFSDETIGFTTYVKSTTKDAGAGNFYETTTYKLIKNRKCYSLQYTIHSTNIGNYSPEQNITEFDKAKIVNIFEGIMKTIKFL